MNGRPPEVRAVGTVAISSFAWLIGRKEPMMCRSTRRGDATRPMIHMAARPLLASIFISGGLDAFRNPGSKSAQADTLLAPVLGRAGVPTEQIVRLDGAAKVLGGLALGLGVFPRVAALGLAASLVPTTVAGHPFWTHTDPGSRAMHRVHFLKNASILGGLLAVVAADRSKR